MASDDFGFDAYDRLVGRPSMAGSPVSLLVRAPSLRSASAALERSLALLSGRRTPDEVVLAFAQEPPSRPPSCMGRISIRSVVHPRAAEREGLEWLIANARWPLAVFVGSEADLPMATFQAVLESLEHADIVVGRRRDARGARNPFGWTLRRLFGVGIRDPLSPYFGLRRETICGLPLELDEPLTLFELLAKGTFAFAIYDEVETSAGDAKAPPLHRVLQGQMGALATLFQWPRFWRYVADGPCRVPPQETHPPRPRDLALIRPTRRASRHPLAPIGPFLGGIKSGGLFVRR